MDVLARIKDVLRLRIDMVIGCGCEFCERTARHAGYRSSACQLCGYRGRMRYTKCRCIEPCAGGIYAPHGCAHGNVTCPRCDDGREIAAVFEELTDLVSELEQPPKLTKRPEDVPDSRQIL